MIIGDLLDPFPVFKSGLLVRSYTSLCSEEPGPWSTSKILHTWCTEPVTAKVCMLGVLRAPGPEAPNLHGSPLDRITALDLYGSY
jgi:hypothetical protein